MLRKNHLLFALVMSFSASAFALVGGPFDNGDYNQLLDDRAVYQASLTMTNGLGMLQFGSNVSLGPTLAAGGSTSSTTQTNNSIGTVLDRSVIYYKGVVYFGMATGMVDLERKTITGFTNGSPNASLSQSTASSASGTAGTAGLSANQIVVSNGGLGFTCNTAWTAHITESSSMLKFDGSGTLTIINPDINAQIFSAVVNLVAAIPSAASSTTSSGTGSTGTSVTALTNAINSLITLATDGTLDSVASDTASADAVYQTTENVPIKVSGSRKYFLSTR